jgi:CRISPR-associated endonuclease/helicase Cas3
LQSPLSEDQEVSLEAAYPRITWGDATACGARQIAVSAQAERTLTIEWINGRLPQNEADGFVLGEKLQAALRQGGCAAVICNTVNRAQQVYLALKPYFAAAELDLLHARFLFRDRNEREKNALVNFGKAGEIIRFDEGDTRQVSRPHRKVLVATQVIEQSLDLDFDLMVTDLAPVDLLLQRSGRLHRHERPRPEGLSQPTLWICQPEEVSDDVPVFDRGTEAVYDAHILLRSWLALHARGAITIPDEIEALIESVYGEVCCPETASSNLRVVWQETLEQRIKDIQNEEEEAKNRWLKHPQFSGAVWRLTADPKDEDAPDFHQAHQALTRLAADSVNVVFLYEKSGQLFLDEDRKHLIELPAKIPIGSVKLLLKNSVSISSRAVIYQLKALPVPSSWQKNALLRQCRLLTLNEAGFAPVNNHTIRLSSELGVLIERNS